MAQVLIGQCDIEDVVLIRDLNLIFVFLLRYFSGLRIRVSGGACSGLCPVPDLDLFLKLQLILTIKEGTQSGLNLASGIILELNRQIGCQLIGVMADLVQIVVVFVIAGIGGFDVIDLPLQLCFQRLVVVVCTDDIFILCCKRGCHNGSGTSRKESRAGRQR